MFDIPAVIVSPYNLKADVEKPPFLDLVNVIVNEFGEDTDKDLKWVLRELKALLESAKGDEDRMMQLGALKELRQSLMSLADLHGKLNKKMDIHLNLNESPQFIQLRSIILKVLNNHPAAKHEFLNEMDAMGVIQEPVLMDDRRP